MLQTFVANWQVLCQKHRKISQHIVRGPIWGLVITPNVNSARGIGSIVARFSGTAKTMCGHSISLYRPDEAYKQVPHHGWTVEIKLTFHRMRAILESNNHKSIYAFEDSRSATGLSNLRELRPRSEGQIPSHGFCYCDKLHRWSVEIYLRLTVRTFGQLLLSTENSC